MNQAPLGETKHQLILGACASTVVKCQQRKSACVIMKKRMDKHIYLLTILQIFFIKLTDEEALRVINETSKLNHNTKKRKVFYRFLRLDLPMQKMI